MNSKNNFDVDFFKKQRWFQGKGREISEIYLFDEAIVSASRRTKLFFKKKVSVVFQLFKVTYSCKDYEYYFIPKSERLNQDAFESDDFIYIVNENIKNNSEIETLNKGKFIFERDSNMKVGSKSQKMKVQHIDAGSSNSLVNVNNDEVVKIYRKIHSGENLEVSFGKFFNNQSYFSKFSKILGNVSYIDNKNQTHSVLLIQNFVLNEGPAWTIAVEKVKSYLNENYEDQGNEIPFVDHARSMARVISSMHLSLSNKNENFPEFNPEEITRSDLENLSVNLAKSADNILESASKLSQPLIDNILEKKSEIFLHYKDLANFTGDVGKKIRIHGDLHLGQILRTKSDDSYVIIDFEGEPLKSLEERKLKFLPMKDIAGMIRSFHYAAYSGFFALNKPELESKAILWYEIVSQEFLKEYKKCCKNMDTIPKDECSFERLLAIFKLEKAIYELNYEMNNRVDWLKIPVKGILATLKELRRTNESFNIN